MKRVLSFKSTFHDLFSRTSMTLPFALFRANIRRASVDLCFFSRKNPKETHCQQALLQEEYWRISPTPKSAHCGCPSFCTILYTFTLHECTVSSSSSPSPSSSCGLVPKGFAAASSPSPSVIGVTPLDPSDNGGERAFESADGGAPAPSDFVTAELEGWKRVTDFADESASGFAEGVPNEKATLELRLAGLPKGFGVVVDPMVTAVDEELPPKIFVEDVEDEVLPKELADGTVGAELPPKTIEDGVGVAVVEPPPKAVVDPAEADSDGGLPNIDPPNADADLFEDAGLGVNVDPPAGLLAVSPPFGGAGGKANPPCLLEELDDGADVPNGLEEEEAPKEKLCTGFGIVGRLDDAPAPNNGPEHDGWEEPPAEGLLSSSFLTVFCIDL